MTVAVRLVAPDDAEELAALLRENREFLAPWEPLRDDAWFTAEGQRSRLAALLESHAAGTVLPCAISLDGRLVGRITLTGISRGPFQSADLGYWVAGDVNGRGVATSAVGEVVRRAFDDVGLHRVQAAVLPHNAASARVLARNGFERIGLASRYLRIAGHWQDHVLHQRVHD